MESGKGFPPPQISNKELNRVATLMTEQNSRTFPGP